MASPLERFLPDLLRRRLHLGASPIDAAYCEEVPGTALFCDITGFTPLTESLVREGPDGVERLTEILNSYFGQLIDLVQGHGGDIVKFAGDALLALWQCPDAVGLRDSTRRAVQCGLEIQKRLTGFDSGAGVKLQQRVAIGCGTLQTAYLGGALGRWEFVVAGEPLRQITPAMASAKPGSVTVAGKAWGLLEGMFRGTPSLEGVTRPVCPT